MKYIFFLLAACLLFTFGCKEEVEPAADHQIMLNTSFSIKPPQQARSEDLELKVLQINDSRCPADVQCMWEGEVDVKLAVQLAGNTEELALVLHRPELDVKNTAEVGDYRITLEWVSVPPSHKANWQLEDYDLRLRVEKI